MSGAADRTGTLLAAVAADANAVTSLAQLGDALVRRLAGYIAMDRFNIGLIDAHLHLFHDAYVSGRNVAGRETGHRRTLDGTVVEAAMRVGRTFQFGDAGRAGWLARFPLFGPVFDSGIRAMMAVPLKSEGTVAATLVFASRDPAAYGPDEQALATAIGAAVATRITTFGRLDAPPPS